MLPETQFVYSQASSSTQPGPSGLQREHYSALAKAEIHFHYLPLVGDEYNSIHLLPNVIVAQHLQLHGIDSRKLHPLLLKDILYNHLLLGKCCSTGSPGMNCLPIKLAFQTPSEFARPLIEHILVNEKRLLHLARVCTVLGRPQPTSSSSTNASELRKFLSDVIDDFRLYNNIDDVLTTVDNLPLAMLILLTNVHGISVSPDDVSCPDKEDFLRAQLLRHFCETSCTLEPRRTADGLFAPCGAADAERSRKLRTFLPLVAARNNVSYRTRLLTLKSLGLVVPPQVDTKRKIINFAKKQIEALTSDNSSSVSLPSPPIARTVNSVESALDNLRMSWPSKLSEADKLSIIDSFQKATSAEALLHTPCAVCSESKPPAEMVSDPVDVDNDILSPLRKEFPPNVPNPYSSHPLLANYPLDPNGVLSVTETFATLRICISCHSQLIEHNSLPKLSIANNLFLGDVPDCLKDLTLMEESMIARRRAKLCILHLRANENSTSSAIAQRGLRGHAIVYPTNPDNLASVLPLSLSEAATPICVLFVGSEKPSQQWLMTHAKPLVVRREKVRAALEWLKQNNPLYRTVNLDFSEINAMAETFLAPVEITLSKSSSSSDETTSTYVPITGDNLPPDIESQIAGTVISDIEGKSVTVQQMKAAALQHLRKGGKHIQIPHGSLPSNTYEDYELFPSLYPTLYPFGVGGFEHPDQPLKLSMRKHVEHLLNLNDTRFQTHQSFMFLAFNILQRRDVNLNARFKTNRANFANVAAQLSAVSDDAIQRVAKKLSSGERFSPETNEDRVMLRLMSEVKLINSKVEGTAASRIAMRNEIRAMMLQYGTPSFYITINPADVYSPILRFLAGSEIELDNILPDNVPSFWHQARLVAKNPCLAAKFFHIVMQTFFSSILGFKEPLDPLNKGALGLCKGYYGCVEAQGRGSLHCHLFVWLEGALNPDQIKDRLQCPEFAEKLCSFLDDTIFTEVPPIPNEDSATNLPHPCSTTGPAISNESSLTDDLHRLDLHRIAKACQRHSHSATCYKYSSPTNKSCRFDLDESHFVSHTHIDTNTREIKYRISDGMVNNFCDTILRAIRCNMDIKFIGSGRSAKAILYYITDYITKAQLKAHVAYATLEAAVTKLRRQEQAASPCETDVEKRARKLLIRCANALISQQELSAPQISSYLLSYGDHYTSHMFQNLYWNSFEKYIDDSQREEAPPISATTTDNDMSYDDVVIQSDNTGRLVAKCSQVVDYIYRGADLDNLSVWDMIRSQSKETISSLQSRRQTHIGRPSAQRSMFSSQHPDHETHILKTRANGKWRVPVPIGGGLPRRDRDDLKQRHAKIMLILFKPWRTVSDLLDNNSSWLSSYETFLHTCSDECKQIIENMQILHECKDSRDDHFDQMRSKNRQAVRSMDLQSTESQATHVDIDDDFDENDEQLLDFLEEAQEKAGMSSPENESNTSEAVLAARLSGLFDVSMQAPLHTTALPNWPDATNIDELGPDNQSWESVWKHSYKERRAKYKATLQTNDVPSAIPDGTAESTFSNNSLLPPSISSAALQRTFSSFDDHDVERSSQRSADENNLRDLSLEDLKTHIIRKFSLNVEQAAAFSVIASHTESREGQTPLRMYLGGPGGTGKSRVIDACRAFFSLRRESRRFRVAAYTGVASLNVGGMTLHTLLNMSTSEKEEKAVSLASHQMLVKMWEGVDFLFIDEISMIGCEFLSKISDLLGRAKENTEPFGGLHIVFAGDFCQLPPIGETRLFSRRTKTAGSTLSNRRQSADFGKFLWSGLTHCVLLNKQMRQSGPENQPFRELLSRLHAGTVTEDDVELLQSRTISNIDSSILQRPEWKDAPIITTTNDSKDALNMQAAEAFALRTGQEFHVYHSIDTRGGKVVNPEIKSFLNTVSSAKTGHLLPLLPLVPGMKVIFNQNYDIEGGIVNGTQGTLKSVRFVTGPNGERIAKSCVVLVEGLTCENLPFLHEKEVVALQEDKEIKFIHPMSKKSTTFRRRQLPIQPAFAITDWKAQGATLERAIVDLTYARSFQSIYVMISRCTSLDGLLFLRPFSKFKLRKRMPDDLRRELRRLSFVHDRTMAAVRNSSVVNNPPSPSASGNCSVTAHGPTPTTSASSSTDYRSSTTYASSQPSSVFDGAMSDSETSDSSMAVGSQPSDTQSRKRKRLCDEVRRPSKRTSVPT